MMTITAENIKDIIKHGEHSTLEMKKCKKSVPDSVWETYSAFANTRGGVILLGVNEDKEKPLAERFVVTNIGAGFMKIIKAWATLGFDSPEIHEESEINEVWLTLPLIPRRDSTEGTEKGTKDTEKGTKELNALIPAELLDTLTEDQRKILEYVQNNPEITLVELSEKMNTSIKSIRVQRKKLENMGIFMVHVGAQKSGTWQIRIHKD